MFDFHKCKICCKGVKEIPVSSFFDCSTDDGEKMVGVGLNGVRYWLVVKSREALPWLSDENLQGDESDEDLTEPVGVLSNDVFHKELFVSIIEFLVLSPRVLV
jgi:hypothetical protein